MKNILFAIAMEKLNSSKAEAFEQRVITSLRSGSRDYKDIQPFHCDHKGGILNMCIQNDIDVLVVNENVQGSGDLLSILKEVKSELPAILIVLLLTSNRGVGDAFLANAVTCGVYNWLTSPWTPEDLANIIISPKKLKNVEMYMPKIVEGKDGLAFDTVVVEKGVNEKPEDLPDIFGGGVNNAETISGIDDIELKKETKSMGYSRKISGSRFGFGRTLKPKAISEEEKEIPKVEEPVVEDIVKEEPPAAVKEKPDLEKPTETVKEKPATPTFKAFFEKSKKEALEKAILEAEKPVEKPKIEEQNEKPVEKPTEIKQEVPIYKEAVKKPKPVLKLKEEKTLTDTLQSISFTPRYESILFIRALPFSSLIPVHVAKLSDMPLVDFNKETSYDGYPIDLVRTTIKECYIPDGPVIGDVVVGNGVENLLGKFEHVVVIMPEDPYVMETFVKRYPFIRDCGVVVDKCTTGVLTRKQLNKLVPECQYIDTVKTENCAKVLSEASINRTLLMDDPEYCLALKWILKDLEV